VDQQRSTQLVAVARKTNFSGVTK